MAKGAVLIGCGFMPSQEDVKMAVSKGCVKNADAITTYSGAQDMPQDQAIMRHAMALMSKGWDMPLQGVTAEKLTLGSGRIMWVVYPTA